MSEINVTGSLDSSILNRVRRLFTTPSNSLPYDRDFGVDMSVLDQPKAASEGALLAEYTLKLKEYFPDLKISQITFEVSGQILIPTVVIVNA